MKIEVRILLLIMVCGISRAASFSGPASVTFIGTSTVGPGSAACQSALGFASTLAVADTPDGYRVTGDASITSAGIDPATGVEACNVYMFFGRITDEPAGTVLTTEGSMSGTVDADGPFQLFGIVFGYFTHISGRNSGGCGGTAAAPTPGAGIGVPFSSGPVTAGPCTLNSLPQFANLQGVFLSTVNDQPGEITFHFDSLVSEAHVQPIPEPGSGLTVFLGLMIASGAARQLRRRKFASGI
jgi:hypothetical protein